MKAYAGVSRHKGNGCLLPALGAAFALMPSFCAAASAPVDGVPESFTVAAEDSGISSGARVPQWLDEVRAQRQAWETRRDATRQAMDARRRWVDPWGAAQHEAREREVEQRRQANRERIELERQLFRSQRPALGPYPEVLAPPIAWEPQAPPLPEPAGWDNRWYYQGF